MSPKSQKVLEHKTINKCWLPFLFAVQVVFHRIVLITKASYILTYRFTLSSVETIFSVLSRTLFTDLMMVPKFVQNQPKVKRGALFFAM